MNLEGRLDNEETILADCDIDGEYVPFVLRQETELLSCCSFLLAIDPDSRRDLSKFLFSVVQSW